MAKADLQLGPNQLLPGAQPWTEQPGGCGVQGRQVHVPLGFFDFKLSNGSDWQLRDKGE